MLPSCFMTLQYFDMKMDSLAKSSTEFGSVTTTVDVTRALSQMHREALTTIASDNGVTLTNFVLDTTFFYSAETTPNINVSLAEIVWHMPVGILLSTMVILTCELFLSILTNAALVLTIYHSPNLKSPPNNHL